jgi:Gpi18-like mannosyltransferase/predicted membrane-bound dolichyl-phosphate-mannose-protein mannosyltransferase
LLKFLSPVLNLEQPTSKLKLGAAKGFTLALILAMLSGVATAMPASASPAPLGLDYDTGLGLLAGIVLLCVCARSVYVNLRVLAAQPREETALMLAVLVSLTLIKCALLGVFPGVAVDVNTYQAWASKLTLLGARHAYEPGYFLDYPPGYLYVLWAIGSIARHLNLAGEGLRLLVESPPLVADALIGALLFARIRERGDRAAAFGGMLVFALNPGLLFDTVVWGQSDSVPTLLMLLALLAALDGRYASCWALGAAAALIKPQGLILMPLLAWWTLLEAPARQWLKSAAAALALALLAIAPFQLGHQPGWIFSLYRSTASYYHETSVNAFNVMALVGGLREPDAGTLLGVSYFAWGLTLAAGWYVFAAALLWRERSARSLFLAAAMVFFGSFMLLPRMHERYLYPVLVLLIPLALDDDVVMAVEGILTATFLFNLYQVAQILQNATFLRSREPSAMVAAAVNVVALALLTFRAVERAWPRACLRLAHWARAALGAADRASSSADGAGPPAAAAVAPLEAGSRGGLSRARGVRGESAHERGGIAALEDGGATGVKLWLGLDRIGAPPRWSGLDTLILTCLTALSTVSRFWRLDRPASIVFDEVHFVTQARHYLHAESFLDPHPPLAKLLIALGIGLFGDHPMSWRLANAALGTVLIGLTYLLGRRLFGNRLAAALAGGAVLCDGMFLVDSRVAVIDIVYLTCAAWSYLLLFRFLQSREQADARRTLGWLGVSLGLCLSAKLYVPAATFVLVAGFVLLRLCSPRLGTAGGRKLLGRHAIGALALLCGVSATVYLAIFLPHYWLGWWRGLGDLFAYYEGVVWYERSVYAATHPYAAPWWSWPLMLRPIAYWQNFPDRGNVAVIWGGGNPVLWWGALSAIAITAMKLKRGADLSRVFLVAGYVLYLAIWVPIGRTLFLYHYMPAVYCGFLALGASLAECWEGRAEAWEHALLMLPVAAACLLGLKPGLGVLAVAALAGLYAAVRRLDEPRSGKFVCAVFTGAALVLFVYYFPVWVGSPLPRAAYYRRMWLQGPGLGNWI